MDFGFTAEEEAFYREVQDFLKNEVTEELIKETEPGPGPGPHSRAFDRKMGARGWYCITLPKEYGGLGASYVKRFIMDDELTYHRASAVMKVAARIVAPTLLHHGTEEQKQYYLPRIARGEIEFALGYTEPQAGSDLGALRIRATEDGGDYIINGQKVFNTGTHHADYIWLLARTDPSAPRHRGISLFIVDAKTPGINLRPLWVIDGERTNEVFYDDVRVPGKNMVGEKNRGFYVVVSALAFERAYASGGVRRIFDELVEYARNNTRNGVLIADDPVVRQELGQMAVEVRLAQLIGYRIAWLCDQGITPEWQAPVSKLFVTELMQRIARVGFHILGPYALLEEDSKWAQLRGKISQLYRHGIRRTISGGTSEIQRNTIAARGLGLPRK